MRKRNSGVLSPRGNNNDFQTGGKTARPPAYPGVQPGAPPEGGHRAREDPEGRRDGAHHDQAQGGPRPVEPRGPHRGAGAVPREF